MVKYQDGERRYILMPLGLKEGGRVISSESAPVEVGMILTAAALARRKFLSGPSTVF